MNSHNKIVSIALIALVSFSNNFVAETKAENVQRATLPSGRISLNGPVRTSLECEAVKNQPFPTTEPAFTNYQMAAVRCALFLQDKMYIQRQLVRNGKRVPKNCVTFAYTLMAVLRPSALKSISHKNTTANDYITALKSKRLFSISIDNSTGRPKPEPTAPVFLWWPSNKNNAAGHVAVYIGNGLFLDNVAADAISLSKAKLNPNSRALNWAWSTNVLGQRFVNWDSITGYKWIRGGFWPTRSAAAGSSTSAVNVDPNAYIYPYVNTFNINYP